MSEVTWTVTEPNGEAKTVGKKTQLAYLEAFESNSNTPKAQLVTINGWNAMRQCLLDNGLMKTK